MKNALIIFGLIACAGMLFASAPVFAGVASVTVKAIQKTITKAAGKSGKVLTPALREASEKALAKAVGKYGDDALKIVEKGGLEALDQGAKYGDDFWNLCRHASPRGVRSLATHADDLMPIAKRIGPDFVELEGKVPGLGKKLIENFGDDAVRTLKDVSEKDLTRLAGLSAKTNDPATRRLLLEQYGKTNGKILDHIKPGHILAGGLTAATIMIAAKACDEIEKNPDHLAKWIFKPMWWLIAAVVGILMLPFICKMILFKLVPMFRGFFNHRKM